MNRLSRTPRSPSRALHRSLTLPVAQVFNAAFVLEISPDCQVAPPLRPSARGTRRQHVVLM